MYRLNYHNQHIKDDYWDMKQEFKENQELIFGLKKAYKSVKRNRSSKEIEYRDIRNMINLKRSQDFWDKENKRLEKIVF